MNVSSKVLKLKKEGNIDILNLKNKPEIIEKLIDMLYERNNLDLKRGSFRVRGDILEIIPVSQHGKGIRIDFFGDEIEKISEI